MADNITLNAGSGGAVLATDDVGGAHYQLVKLAYGALDSATLVESSAGLPTIITGAGLTALQLIDDTVATVGSAVPAKGQAVAGSDGTDARLLKTDTSGELQIDVLTLPGVAGTVAHDGADSGNPVKIGAYATSSEPAAVASGDRANLIADLVGKLITLPYANPENQISGTASATDTNDTAIIAAQGAGVRAYATTIVVANTSATDTIVTIKDGSTAKLVIPCPAKSGAVVTLPVPLKTTANTALNFAAGTGSSTIYVSAVGYKGA